MLAEVQAANDALGTILSVVQRGGDIADMAETCGRYFNNKSVVARCSNKRGTKSQLVTFMELEKLRKQEQRLKELMIYAGDPGMWERWLQFQSHCKKLRASEDRKKKRKQDADMDEVMKYLKYFSGGVSFIISSLFGTFQILEFMETR